MTREQQVANDKRYADWHKVYVEEVYDRATHWGDGHKSPSRKDTRKDTMNEQAIEGEL